MKNDRRDERRQYVRIEYGTNAEVRTADGKFNCFTMNINAGGLLIKTDHPLAVGEKVEVQFLLPHHEKQIAVKGIVIRKAVDTFGIKFNKVIKGLLHK